MAGHRAQKDLTLKGLFTKFPAKKTDWTWEALPPPQMSHEPQTQEYTGAEAAVTRSFMETLLSALWTDIATLQEAITVDIKELKKDITKIRGVLLQLGAGDLERYISNLFRHILPDLAGKEVVLDFTHRVDSVPGMHQDILTYIHYFCQKEAIMAAVWGRASIMFEGGQVWLYQDLFPITLQCRCTLGAGTSFLWENGVKYKCGHSFHRIFMWNKKTDMIRSMEDAKLILGLEAD
ncbi:hypothetical protein NDU88_005055 [Pleurodeles waltl]|uniref:Uncharacterized protein n=1 Tax=Pleurodeles waltl TaxID=8319 RepID=A0AAV7UHH7_PLEWA|nr:hypothetical protein NDU88_005055 [Pleurodeles waltl]